MNIKINMDTRIFIIIITNFCLKITTTLIKKEKADMDFKQHANIHGHGMNNHHVNILADQSILNMAVLNQAYKT